MVDSLVYFIVDIFFLGILDEEPRAGAEGTWSVQLFQIIGFHIPRANQS